MAGMRTDSGRNENFFEQHTFSAQRKFWLDCTVDVKSSTMEQHQKSTVTTNCRAILIVHSHLPLLPLSFFSSTTATAAIVVMVSVFLYSLSRTLPRGPCCQTTSAPPTTSVQTQDGGLAFATRGQCNQRYDEHPHHTNMLQIKRGNLYH